MFVWVEFYFGDVPDKTGSVLTPELQFWIRLAEVGLLTAPGWFFSPPKHAEGSVPPFDNKDPQAGHLRLSYHAI